MICVIRGVVSEKSIRKRDTNNLVNHRLYESEDIPGNFGQLPDIQEQHHIPWGVAASAAYGRQGLDQVQLQVSFYLVLKSLFVQLSSPISISENGV